MTLLRPKLWLLAGLTGTGLFGCATETEDDPELPSPTSKPDDTSRVGIESQCGPTWDAQPIEQYSGNAGVPTYFTAFHESRVGYHIGGCSGTLISDDLFLSAGHCNYAVDDTVTFNYQNAPNGSPRPTSSYSVIEVVEQEFSVNWDYSIVRLGGSPGREFGHANIAAIDPPAGSTVAIIGHPASRPKEIHAGAVASFASPYGPNSFSYFVDTQPGSNGSGILDVQGRLIGVHTNDGCEGYPFDGNSGMRMSQLVPHSPTLSALTRSKVLWRYGSTSLVSLWTVNAAGAMLGATSFEPGTGWSPLTYSNNRMIWRHTDGRISYWRLDDANTPLSYVEAGRYTGWVAISAANDRVLWRNGITNNIWLNSVDANGNLLSSIPHTVAAGWRPINYANNHILWRHTDGLTALWRVDDAGNYVSSVSFNPGAGWIPISYENGQLLWRHTDGRISVWNLTRDNTHLSYAESPASPGWTALMSSDRKIAWRHTSGLFSMWNVNSYGAKLSDYAHSVGLDWTPVAIAGARP